jgi:chorismate-pyruvate lyase
METAHARSSADHPDALGPLTTPRPDGGDRGREWAPINLRALSPFQRALLATDGTVTKFIEAYMLEPVEIVRLGESHGPIAEDDPWLQVRRGDEVSTREVVIQGRYSHTLYVYAVSLVALDRLPERIRQGLQVQGEGLGRLLNEAELETRREVLWHARERVQGLPDPVRNRTDGEFVARIYRIITQRQPIALITERFPCDLGRLQVRE